MGIKLEYVSVFPSIATNFYRQTHLPLLKKVKKSHFWWNMLKELFLVKVKLWRGLPIVGFNLQSALDLGLITNFNIYIFSNTRYFLQLAISKISNLFQIFRQRLY